MHKMKHILTALLALYGCAVTAQEEETTQQDDIVVETPVLRVYSYALKLYATETMTRYPGNFNGDLQYRLQPGAALMVRTRKGNYHEVELSKLDIRRNVTEFPQPLYSSYRQLYQESQVAIAMRYEYIIPFIKRPGARFVPSLGVAAMPYFERIALVPYLTPYYSMATTSVGIRTFIVPRLQVNITKRLFADVNIPICTTDMAAVRQHIDDPTLADEAQNYSTGNFNALPTYVSARIGLGLKL